MVRYWLYGAAAAFSTAGTARILFLFLFRKPVQANTRDTDLTEMQRRHDYAMHRRAHFDGIPTPDDIPVRIVRARVAYEINGIEHRADVRLLTDKGYRAEALPVIWYDPADPSRVTGLGLAPAALLLLVGGALAVAGYHCPF